MNKRAEDILMRVLNGEVKVADLAKRYAVTERTIRNDVNLINEYLGQYDLSQMSISNSVVKSEITKNQFMAKTGNRRSFYDYKLSKEERVQIIAKVLIEKKGFITLGDLAEMLYVSRATVINDLPKLKAFASDVGLSVISQSSKGISVVGKEATKRRVLLNILLDFKDNDVLSQDFYSGDIVVSDQLAKILNNLEHVHGLYFTDESFKAMIKYLQIMLVRVLDGHILEEQAPMKSDKLEMAEDILEHVEQYLEIPLVKDEAVLLAEILEQLRYLKQNVQDAEAVKIQFLTRRYVEAISSELGIDLKHDFEFFENLSNHLTSIFTKSFINLGNDEVLQATLEANQEVLSIAKKHGHLIQSFVDRQMLEDEFAYIVLHICAAIERNRNVDYLYRAILVCHGGVGTSHLLIEQLKRYFNFHFIRVISAHDLKETYFAEADIVLSTIPIETSHSNYIQVNSILTDTDYMKIGVKLESIQVTKKAKKSTSSNTKNIMGFLAPLLEKELNISNHKIDKIESYLAKYFGETREGKETFLLRDLLKEENIQVDVEAKDCQEAIVKAAEPLVKEGIIEPRYVEAMLENLQKNGAYFVMRNGLAIPHEGLDAGTNGVGMNLIRLKKPVPFGREHFDPVTYVCALSAVDKKKHLPAFFHLVNLFANSKFKEELEKCETSREIATLISKFEQEIEK